MENRKIEALKQLLTLYPFHSVLWQLYSTCRLFHDMKPRDDVSKKLILMRDTDLLYIQDTDDLVEGFYVNGNICHLVDCHLRSYIIPLEWVFRIVLSNGVFLLREYSFCCRMNVVFKGETTCLYKQELCVDHLNECPEMFHIGLGRCMGRETQIFHRDCDIYYGWKLIYDYIRKKKM